MIRRILHAAALALAFAQAGTAARAAEEVVAALSQDRVSISTSFDGSEILVYGAIKRTAPAAPTPPLGVIVTVAGPDRPVVVRRKERRFGIWVNTQSLEIERAPTFYAIATSGPFAATLGTNGDRRFRITTPRTVSAPSTLPGPEAERFRRALIRVRRDAGSFVSAEGAVDLREETLFSTRIALPANLTEGNYTTRIFLTRGGGVVDSHKTEIFVQKVGLERFVYNLAHERPLFYGIASLVIAVVSGWLASAAFGLLRRG